MCGFKCAYDCIKAFSVMNCTEDLKSMDIPVLVIHGEDGEIVPIDASAHAGAKLLKQGKLKTYPGSPHAMPNIVIDEVNQNLLELLE
jgi:non-heme chloroperoxidase